MNTKKLWELAWLVPPLCWMMTIVIWLETLATVPPHDTHTQPLGPWWGLVLWVVIPIFWMMCSGFGLNDYYERELGWRKENYGPNNEYIRKVDTTPGKRIIMQWLAPFVLAYFIIVGKPHSTA